MINELLLIKFKDYNKYLSRYTYIGLGMKYVNDGRLVK